MKLMIVGSTGLVGGHALRIALADPRIERVIAPVRKPAAEHPKLLAPLVDFAALPADAPWWEVDAVVCALGTTIRIAGSQEAFRRVDHDYPLLVAQLARQHGARTFVLNSAMGADPASRIFYSRVKGEVERDLAALDFASLTLVRPGLIGGEREEFRLGERVATVALRALHPLIPRRWRINPAQRIAHCMIDAAVEGKAGVHVVASDALT